MELKLCALSIVGKLVKDIVHPKRGILKKIKTFSCCRLSKQPTNTFSFQGILGINKGDLHQKLQQYGTCNSF
jgi:hypothetical protein